MIQSPAGAQYLDQPAGAMQSLTKPRDSEDAAAPTVVAARGGEPASAGPGEPFPNGWAFSSPEEAAAAVGRSSSPPSHRLTAILRALLTGTTTSAADAEAGLFEAGGRAGDEAVDPPEVDPGVSGTAPLLPGRKPLLAVPPMVRVSFADSAVPMSGSPRKPSASASASHTPSRVVVGEIGPAMAKAPSPPAQRLKSESPSPLNSPNLRRISVTDSIEDESSHGSLYTAGSAPMSPTWTAKAQPGAKAWYTCGRCCPMNATGVDMLCGFQITDKSLHTCRSKVDKEGNVMLGVRLIQADLSSINGASKRSWDPFAVVKCEKTRKYSKAVTNVSKGLHGAGSLAEGRNQRAWGVLTLFTMFCVIMIITTWHPDP